MAQQTSATIESLWAWLSSQNGFFFQEPRLAAAAAAVQPFTQDAEHAKYNELGILIKNAVSRLPGRQIPPSQMTKSGVLTLLQPSLAFAASFAVGVVALATLCRKMNLGTLITNVFRGSIIIHFRLTVTLDSAMTALQGYDWLAALQLDGTMEREIGLGPLHFELENCVDDSLPLLLHQQRSNFEQANIKLCGGLAVLKPEYTAKEVEMVSSAAVTIAVQVHARDTGQAAHGILDKQTDAHFSSVKSKSENLDELDAQLKDMNRHMSAMSPITPLTAQKHTPIKASLGGSTANPLPQVRSFPTKKQDNMPPGWIRCCDVEGKRGFVTLRS